MKKKWNVYILQNILAYFQPYVAKALQDYPETSAVIIRRHGMYVVGPTWEKTKLM